MQITIFSVIYSIIIATIIFTILCLLRRKILLKTDNDIRLFSLFYFVAFSRLLIPIDFIFSKEIRLEGIFSKFINFIFLEKYRIIHMQLSLVQMTACFIICVSLIKIIIYFYQYHKTYNYFVQCSENGSQQAYSILQKIKKIYHSKKKCLIIVCPRIDVPLTTGIIKKIIILPQDVYSDKELYYILLHEYTHVVKYDLIKKMCLDIFSCLFWWIPFNEFIVKDITQFMEIRCDRSLLKSDTDSDIVDYMETLLEALKRKNDKQNSKLMKTSLQLSFGESYSALKERFLLMINENTNKNRIALGVILFCVYVSSFCMVPQSYYEPPSYEENNSSYYITSENAYILLEDGVYYFISGDNPRYQLSKEHALNMEKQGIIIKEVN